MRILTRKALKEIEIKKSRFIALARSVDSPDKAKNELKTAWQEHPQATHIVYAYQIGKTADVFGLSDDGEPHGTAGRPVLEVVKGSGITNLLIMVVRYFGGTKLGTGGLVKAYTTAAQEVLSILPTEELIDKYNFQVQLPYALYESARMLLESHSAQIENEEFLTEVKISGTLPQNKGETIHTALLELSAGKIEVKLSDPS